MCFITSARSACPCLDCLDLGVYAIPVVRYGRELFRELRIAVYPVFGQKIHRPCRLFQVVQFRPMGEPRALLCFEIVLNWGEQADPTVTLFRLAGRTGASGVSATNFSVRLVMASSV